jgi:hypothetical protein
MSPEASAWLANVRAEARLRALSSSSFAVQLRLGGDSPLKT